jgi:DNA-binding transcriptional ArsR family regulator
MVEKHAVPLDRILRALASEPRREILRRVAMQACTVTRLTEHFDLSLAAVSKHMRVLQNAHLVTQTKQGRFHWYRLNAGALEAARAAIDELTEFWSKQLAGLEGYLAMKKEEPPRTARRRKRGRS